MSNWDGGLDRRDTSLVAMLLAIRTRTGPRIVLHYPVSTGLVTAKSAWDEYGSSSSSSDNDSRVGDLDKEDFADENDSELASPRHDQWCGSIAKTEIFLKSPVDNGSDEMFGYPKKPKYKGKNKRNGHRYTSDVDQELMDVTSVDFEGEESVRKRLTSKLDRSLLNEWSASKLVNSYSETPTNSRYQESNYFNDKLLGTDTGIMDEIEEGASTCLEESLHMEDWEYIFGYPTDDLAKLLCPDRVFDGSRFELTVGDLTFVGAPMFADETGIWEASGNRNSKSYECISSPVTKTQSNLIESNELVTGKDQVYDDDIIPNLFEKLDINSHNSVSGIPQNNFVNPTTSKISLDVATENSEREVHHTQVSDEFKEDVSINETLIQQMSNSSKFDSPRKSDIFPTINATNFLIMFNIVAVMNPSPLERQCRVEEMYLHILRHFSKSLRLVQAKFNYVWNESRIILGLTDRGREAGVYMKKVWREILEKSSLARAVSNLFTAVSTHRIANIQFVQGYRGISLQIPQARSTSNAPTFTQPQIPGLWLTSSNVNKNDEIDINPSPYHALLLMDGPEDNSSETKNLIVKRLKMFGATIFSDDNERMSEFDEEKFWSMLTKFLEIVTPDKTIYEISQIIRIPISEVMVLARLLIRWRFALAIPTLHLHNIYIVSANADMKRLTQGDVASFARLFPHLPSLPCILSMFSGIPQPKPCIEIILQYETNLALPKYYDNSNSVELEGFNAGSWKASSPSSSPNSQHLETSFMGVLGWLMSRGYVTQLRTFAWIRVCPEIKRLAAQTQDLGTGIIDEKVSSESQAYKPHQQQSSIILDPMQANDLESLWLKFLTSSLETNDDKILQLSDDSNFNPQIAIPELIGTREYHESLNSTSIGNENDLSSIEETCDYVSQLFQGSENPATTKKLVRELWPILLRYFDGKCALEDIPSREGISRVKIFTVLAALERSKWIQVFRHW